MGTTSMPGKYEFTDETIVFEGVTLKRIKALTTTRHVIAGTLGGFIEKEENLAQTEHCFVLNDAKVFGNAKVIGDAKVSQNAVVKGNALVEEKSYVSENAIVSEKAVMMDMAKATGNAKVGGNAVLHNECVVRGNAQVYDRAVMHDHSIAEGNALLFGHAKLMYKARITDNAKIHGETVLSGEFVASGEAEITSGTYERGEVVGGVPEHPDKKYEIMLDRKHAMGDSIVFRIKALKPNLYVPIAGMLGGWIEKEENLSQEDNCWVGDDAAVYENAKVFENAQVRNFARVSGDAQIYGKAHIGDKASVGNRAKVHGEAQVIGMAKIRDSAEVMDTAHIEQTVTVYERAIIRGHPYISGEAQIHGNAQVTDTAQISGSVEIDGNVQLKDHAQIYELSRVSGDAIISGHAIVRENAIVYENATVYEECTVRGNARVYGQAKVHGTSLVQGDTTLFGTVDVFGTVHILGGSYDSGQYQTGELPLPEGYAPPRRRRVHFLFGGDPEFAVVNEDMNVVEASHFFPTGQYHYNQRTDRMTCNTNEIGCNGHSDTAELRTKEAFNTPEEMDKYFQKLLRQAYNGGGDLGIPGVGTLNPSNYGAESLRFYFSPYFSSSTDSTSYGGHIHITSNIPKWWLSIQARLVIPFWISTVSFLLDKLAKTRYDNSGGHYGFFADVRESPYMGSDVLHAAERCGLASFDRTQQDSYGHTGVQVWAGGFKGWEYRSPPTWLAPKNKKYRDALWKTIHMILDADTDEKKEMQIKFIRLFFEKTGTRRRWNDSNRVTMREFKFFASDDSYGQLAQHLLSKAIFDFPSDFVKDLKRAREEMPEYTDFDWFLEMFTAEDIAPLNLNPPGFLPEERARPVVPVAPTFSTMTEAITALKTTLDQAIVQGRTSRLVRNGETDCLRFGVCWRSQRVLDPLTGEATDVEEDVMCSEIAKLSMGLARDTYQTHKARRGFTHTLSPGYKILITGAADTRDDAQTVVYSPVSRFNSNYAVRRVLEAESLKVKGWAVDGLGLKVSLRESTSSIKYIIVALYILWKLDYIRLTQSEPTGGG